MKTVIINPGNSRNTQNNGRYKHQQRCAANKRSYE